MQTLKTAIGSFLKNAGIEKRVKQNNPILIWKNVVGKKIAENTNPEKVEHGILTIKTENASWRQELLFKKSEIITKLNQELGEKTIKEIKYI
jgi:predicted nucleic acid-binding Zn ribbon protein